MADLRRRKPDDDGGKNDDESFGASKADGGSDDEQQQQQPHHRKPTSTLTTADSSDHVNINRICLFLFDFVLIGSHCYEELSPDNYFKIAFRRWRKRLLSLIFMLLLP